MKLNSATQGRRSRTSRSIPFHLAPIDDFGRVLGRLFGELPNAAAPLADLASELSGEGFRPSVELFETEPGLRLLAELPGLTEENIDLRVEDGSLILSGEKVAEERTEKDAIVHSERRFGAFRRTLPLPFEVDLEKTEASFENGVLTVELARSEESEPERRIPIRRRD